eukprot:1140406-Pelagomonas_calceolata.AAC.9
MARRCSLLPLQDKGLWISVHTCSSCHSRVCSCCLNADVERRCSLHLLLDCGTQPSSLQQGPPGIAASAGARDARDKGHKALQAIDASAGIRDTRDKGCKGLQGIAAPAGTRDARYCWPRRDKGRKVLQGIAAPAGKRDARCCRVLQGFAATVASRDAARSTRIRKGPGHLSSRCRQDHTRSCAHVQLYKET